MSAQQANDLAMLESRLAGLDHDATDLLQNALQALNAAKTSGKPWGPQDQEIFDQRANIANATIKRLAPCVPGFDHMLACQRCLVMGSLYFVLRSVTMMGIP